MGHIRRIVVPAARVLLQGLSMAGAAMAGMGHLVPGIRFPQRHESADGERPQDPPAAHPERLVAWPMSDQERHLWAQLGDRAHPRRHTTNERDPR